MKRQRIIYLSIILIFSCIEPTLLDKDCNGVIGGDALVDDCGSCTGGTTNLNFNYFLGCDGECKGRQFDCTYPGDLTCTAPDPPGTCITACNGDYITDCNDDCIHKDDAREFDLCGVCDPCDNGTKGDDCDLWNTTCRGCTDPNAACDSYDEDATVYEQGSCISSSYYCNLGDDGFFKETTPYDPSSPYSASKAGSDHLVRAWYRTYGFPALITNCSNNYGPYQFPEKLIPLMIANCVDEKPLPVYGEGLNVRDWLFVEDHCDAIYSVLQKGAIGETYNIGGHNEIKNIDIVNTICSTLDELKPRSNGSSYSELITYVTDRPGHDFRYAIDASKINKDLGWSPKETFETGIRKTIQWYLDNEQWWRHIQDGTYNQERLGIEKSD